MQVHAHIPVRIDFGGPWTDTPEFYENEPQGGATLNAAIVPLIRNAMGQWHRAYVTGALDPGGSLMEAPEVTVGGPSGPLKERLVRGTYVTYQAGIPTSGLGTSAALNALWLGLIKGVNEPLDSPEARQLIAEKSHRIERELGIIGGKQDQYAAVFGGINLFIFHQDGRVDVRAVPLSPEQAEALQQSLILFDTGKTRLSSTLHEHVWGNYRAGTNRPALVRMREIAFEMFDVLTAGDWPAFGRLLSENWACQKALHPSITNEQIENIFEILQRLGIWGGKACGAGGGGCLLFAVDPSQRRQVEGVLQNLAGELIPFEFDWEGLVVERRGS
jgi:D-glycero-alpha-D-manno-heptose-7-phosphate kinase